MLHNYHHGSFLRSRAALVSLLSLMVLVIFISLSIGPLPNQLANHRDKLLEQLNPLGSSDGRPLTSTPLLEVEEDVAEPQEEYKDVAVSTSTTIHTTSTPTPTPTPSPEPPKSKYAFATFLAGTSTDPKHPYFTAIRLLAYQLLHAPETKSSTPIPFLVLVTTDIPQERRDRLTADGATVIEAPLLNSTWVKPTTASWSAVLTKLRLWTLDEYDLIAFLDGDTVLAGPLDGIFADPAVSPRSTRHLPNATRADEAALPSSYVFAGVPEFTRDHRWPPSATPAGRDYPNPDYLNAGFFVLQPDRALFDYYCSLLEERVRDRFPPTFPEQNLLNYAHRREGNMPWATLGWEWNVHYPTRRDRDGGARSLHVKWWDPEDKEGLGEWLRMWRWRMEGWWEGRESVLSSSDGRAKA